MSLFVYHVFCKFKQLLRADPDAQPAGDVTTLLNYLQGTAVQYRDIGVTAKDQIIGLSTCSEAVTNGRVVLFGRLDK